MSHTSYHPTFNEEVKAEEYDNHFTVEKDPRIQGK